MHPSRISIRKLLENDWFLNLILESNLSDGCPPLLKTIAQRIEIYLSVSQSTNHNSVMTGLTNHECLPSELVLLLLQLNLPKMKSSQHDTPKMISKLY